MATGTEEQDLGAVLARLSALIEDVCLVESGPFLERKQAYCIVRHIKFGPGKKGFGKKAAKTLKDAKTELLDDNLIECPFHVEDDADYSEADDDSCPGEEILATTADVIHQRPVLDSMGTVPRLHSVAPPVTENRYIREPPQPRNTNPPVMPMEHKRMGVRDSLPSGAQFEDQRGQPQLPDRQRQPLYPDQRWQPQFSEQLSQPQVGMKEIPSEVNDTTEKPVNRYSRGNTSYSARSPRLRGG